MSDEAYLKLRNFLDQFPLGYPETPSGVEVKILKRLFTEEEARTAILLTHTPETATRIAKRNKLNEEDLTEKLESMSKKGLIFRIRREGKTLYNSAPFMIGLYEYSVKIIDNDLAKLFKEYYDTAYLDEMGASNVPGFKIVPIEETIETDTILLPYQMLKESIRNSRVISVAECICRKESRINGEGCDHPIETCLSFGIAAEYYIENGMGREITAEEAIKIVEEADQSGLVHASANAKHLSNICNCCPCCCASMKGMIKFGHDKQKYMNAIFESIIDQEACTGCSSCVDRCPVKAITVDDYAIVDRDLCLGCGLCASACSEEAIVLEPRKDGVEPFNRVFEMGMAIIKGKRNSSQ